MGTPMVEPMPEKEIELAAALAVQRYFLEIALTMLFDLQPLGRRKKAFRRLQKALLDRVRKSPAISYPRDADDERMSLESERKLKVFLKHLGERIARET
jgi:hypothetical protein